MLFWESPAGLAVLDLDGVVKEANPAACRMLDRSPDTLRGVSILDFADPGDRPHLAVAWLGASKPSRRRLRLPGGAYADLLLELARDSQGRPVHWQAALLDASEQVETERRLTAGLAQERALSEISEAVAGVSHDYRSALDRAAARVAAVVGDACLITLLTDDSMALAIVAAHHHDPRADGLLTGPGQLVPIAQGLLGQVLRSGEGNRTHEAAQLGIAALARSDYQELFGLGSTLTVPLRAHGWVMGTLSVIRDRGAASYTAEDQAFVQAIADRAALGVDDARLFETLQGELAGRVEAEEERDRFFTLSLDLLWIASVEGHFLRLNPAFESTLGFKAEELLSHPILHFVHPDDRAAIRAVGRRLSHGETALNVETRICCRDGSIKWLRWTCAPHGSLLYGVAHDISDRKRTIEVLARQTQELARSNVELQQFAYVASHDLQEPLRMVASYVKLLERRYQGRLDADADEFIQYAVDGATRMQLLIRDLLEYSRVGWQDWRPLPVDSGRALASALDNLRVSIDQTEAEIVCPVMPGVMGNESQLTQLFQNLVANAIKFRSPQAPRLVVSVDRCGDRWCFSVADNGIGIESRYFERIFTIFQKLHTREHYSGTGMGLAICKKVVQNHGGRIWLESEPGCGSVFHFSLPAEPELETARIHAATLAGA